MSTTKTSEKKKHMHDKSQVHDIKKLQIKIKQFEQELVEKKDKILRAQADLQNYQKRIEKDMENIKENIKNKYILEIIDLMELIQKAINDNNPKEGLGLILKNIENFLEKEDVKSIESIGKKFDHNYHHALSTSQKNDCDDGTIVEEIKKGYKINDKVIRPSQVIVSKKEMEGEKNE